MAACITGLAIMKLEITTGFFGLVGREHDVIQIIAIVPDSEFGAESIARRR